MPNSAIPRVSFIFKFSCTYSQLIRLRFIAYVCSGQKMSIWLVGIPMYRIKKLPDNFLLFSLLYLFSIQCFAAPPWASRESLNNIAPIPVAEVVNKGNKLLSRALEFEKKVLAVGKKGLDVSREKNVISLVRLYVDFSRWDASHPEILEKPFRMWIERKGQAFARSGGQSFDINEEVQKSPAVMLYRLKIMLDRAEYQLQRVLKDEINRPEYISASPSELKLSDGYLRHQSPDYSGQVFFPAGFNSKTLVNQYPHLLIGETFAVGGIWTRGLSEADTYDNQHLKNLVKANKLIKKHDLLVDVLVGSAFPKWVLKKYPEGNTGLGHGADFDISHPMAKPIFRRIFAAHMPLLKPIEDNILSFNLANEPAWLTAKSPYVEKKLGYPSQHTMQKFRHWLQKKYADIAVLNKEWDADFADFKSIQDYAGDNEDSVRWYDWCKFNQDRVTDWFTFLKTEVNKYFPGKPTHIKVINENTINGALVADGVEDHYKLLSNRHNGLDREAMIELTEFNGADTRILSGVSFPVRHKFDGSKEYGIQWLGQSIAFDFQKSLAPDKMLFDSEWHSMSTIAFRDPYLSGSHMAASVWLAHIFGMGANKVWYWGRKGNEIDKRWYSAAFGSFAFNPEVMEAYINSMIDVNALSPNIEAIVKAPRQVAILYSEDSAIQGVPHLNTMLAAYEALIFLGYKPGFLTEKMIAAGKGNNYQWLIIPEVQSISDELRSDFEKFHEQGKKITFLGKGNFTRYQNGRMRTGSAPSFFAPDKEIEVGPVRNLMSDLLMSTPKGLEPEIACLNNDGAPSFGLICRTGVHKGKTVAFIINVTKQKLDFTPQIKGKLITRARDMMTGTDYSKQKFSLQPNDFIILELIN